MLAFLEVDIARLAWRSAGQMICAPDDSARWPELLDEALATTDRAMGTIDGLHPYVAARTGLHDLLLLTAARPLPIHWAADLIARLDQLGASIPTLRLARTRLTLSGTPTTAPIRDVGLLS